MLQKKQKANNKKKTKIIRREKADSLRAQSKILTPEFSELLSKYFLCEKLSMKFINGEDAEKRLRLSKLKKELCTHGIHVSDQILKKIFLTSLDRKNEKSFRVIRNKVCHDCSIKYRDYAVKFREEYGDAMDLYLNKLYEVLAF